MKFYIKQKVFSFKDQFKVTDDNQNLKYEVKGKFMSISNKLELMDSYGKVLLRSQKQIFSLLPKYFIYDANGKELAIIKKKFSIRPNFDMTIMDKQYSVEGSLFGHSFGIINNHNQNVASIGKKLFSWGDTYEIDIDDEENKELFLFVVIIIDQVIHEGSKGSVNHHN
jgi:uncharacterized protein YxjI